MAKPTEYEIYLLLNQARRPLWLAEIDLNGAGLRGADLAGADLRGAYLLGAAYKRLT